MAKILVNVRLTKEIIEKLDTLCNNNRCTRPEMISKLVRESFDFTDIIENKIREVLLKK